MSVGLRKWLEVASGIWRSEVGFPSKYLCHKPATWHSNFFWPGMWSSWNWPVAPKKGLMMHSSEKKRAMLSWWQILLLRTGLPSFSLWKLVREVWLDQELFALSSLWVSRKLDIFVNHYPRLLLDARLLSTSHIPLLFGHITKTWYSGETLMLQKRKRRRSASNLQRSVRLQLQVLRNFEKKVSRHFIISLMLLTLRQLRNMVWWVVRV